MNPDPTKRLNPYAILDRRCERCRHIDHRSVSKPRTTGLRPWLWGTTLVGTPEHSSPRLRTGRSVVRGKLKVNSGSTVQTAFRSDRRLIRVDFLA